MKYVLVTSAAAILAAGSLQLATAATAAEVAAGRSTGATTELEEVIVTAQKTAESASKTPIALSVYSGSELRDRGIVSIADLQNVAPAVNIDRSPFGVNINIRGVTTTDNTSKGSQGVAFSVDGVPIGRPAEIGLSFLDVERVEVLRGPQGTLYGKSSTGGAINVVSNRPKDKFEASAALELGNYNLRRGDLMVNLPVSDRFALRAAVNSNVRDGFLNPVLGNSSNLSGNAARNDQDNQTGRLMALWQPSATASLLLAGSFGHVGGAGPGSAIYSFVQNRSGSASRQVYYNPFGSRMDQRFQNYSAELNLEFGPVKLTYIGARLSFWANNLTSSSNDPNGNTAGPFSGFYNWVNYRGTVDTDSHELRFANAAPQRIEWVAGVNYYKEDIHESDHNWSAPIANATLAGSSNGIDPLNNTVHTSSGAFAQANLHATDALKFTLGVRESSDKVRRRGTFAAGPGPWLDPAGHPCVAPNDCVGGRNDGDQSASKLTYRVGADYQLAANQMVYGSVATGYKEGGFNDFDPSTGGTKAYDPEQLTAYELGYKGQLRPGLQFNSALFYYDYSKSQISSLVNINGNFVIYTRSVPTEIQGWENELHWRPTEGDLLDVTLALEKSKYKSFQAGLFQNVNWSGRRLDKTPATSATLSYAHKWFLPGKGSIQARLTGKYSSSYVVSDFVGAAQYTQDAFTRSEITLGYDNGAGFELTGYVRNLEDKLQLLGAPANVSPTVPNSGNVNVTEPRTIGLRASLRF